MISSKCKGDFFPTKHLEALDAQTCLQAQLGEFARANESREKNWARKSFSLSDSSRRRRSRLILVSLLAGWGKSLITQRKTS